MAKESAWWEVGSAGGQGHRLFAGVDQVGVLFTRRWSGSHTEHPVLTMQENIAIARQMIGHQRRQSNAEIHIRALRYVARYAGGDLVTAAAVHRIYLACGGAQSGHRRALDARDKLRRHHTLDVNTGSHYRLRVERSQLDHFAHLRDGALGRGSHDRPKVARRLAVNEVALAITAVSFDQGEIGVDGIFQHVLAAADRSRLFAFGQ